MIHSLEYLKETSRFKTPRRNLRQPTKAKEHRYERRKARQFMRLGDWLEDAD